MQTMPAIKPTFQQTRIEYVPGMNKYSNLLKDVTEKELLITLIRIFNFLEKDIALLFENDNKEPVKNKLSFSTSNFRSYLQGLNFQKSSK